MGLQGMEILAYFYEPFTEIKCNNVNTIFNLSFKNTNEKLFTCVFTLALKELVCTKYLQLTFQKTSILIPNSNIFWILEQYENSKTIFNLHVSI